MRFFLAKEPFLNHDGRMILAKNTEKDGLEKGGLDDFDDLLHKVGENQDREAFGKIFNYFAPRVKSFLIGKNLDGVTAEELTQDVMITLWQKANMFDSEKAAASTWIFTIARNKMIDFVRKHGRIFYEDPDSIQLTQQEDKEIHSADEIVESKQNKNRLREEIKKLPAEQADLIRKAFFEDKTHAQIAQQENIPLGTVKSRIRLALIKLENALQEKETY